MAEKKKRPVEQTPKKTLPSDSAQRVLQEWWDFEGGKTADKGRATVRGDDPRNENVEDDFRWEGDVMVPVPGKQRGKPDLPPVVLGENAGAAPDQAGGLPEKLGEFTDEQIRMLMDDIYGKKGGGRNKDVGLNPRQGPLINVPPPGSGHKGPLINAPIPGLPTGPKINVAVGPLPGGPKINIAPDLERLPDWLSGGPKQPLINVAPGGKKPDRKTLLALMARNRAKANGYHYIA